MNNREVIRGMDLNRDFFHEFWEPMLKKELSPYREYMACGLVGEGSECFGFDDHFSADHDFGPGFCVFIPEKIAVDYGNIIKEAYERLPYEYKGYKRINTSYGGGRVGVLVLEDFYRKFTGLKDAPSDNLQWFKIPESYLAVATNGEVFMDAYGKFSRIRNVLKDFYPMDVLKKKLAARCAVMAQSGQYNYPRSIKRGDFQASFFAGHEFVKTAMSAIYLLEREYMPYYKWIFRKAEGFHNFSDALKLLKEFTILPESHDSSKLKLEIIENVSEKIANRLRKENMTKTSDSFLQSHGEELMQSIIDDRLRSLHIMIDF